MTTGMMTKTIAGLFPYKHNGGCEDRGQVTVVCNGHGAKGVAHSSNCNYTTLKQRGGYDERSICTKHRV